jgi:Raf kinase inhibitor-like YbhB/YbcL family protein
MQAIQKVTAAAVGSALFAFVVTAMAQTGGPANVFTLSSSSFNDGGYLSPKNGGNNPNSQYCKGENVSPPLQWNNAPADTKSFAVIMVDLHGRIGQGIDHWVAYGIPPSVTGFAEGEVSRSSEKYVGGKGVSGLGTYLGPCPPPGAPRHYAITLIATDLDPKELPPGLTRAELLSKLVGHSKDAAVLIGMYRHL